MKKLLIILSIVFATQINAATVTSSKNSYTTEEDIKVNFNQMTGQNKNWIAIYPARTNNNWENVVDWKWANGVNGTSTFYKLPQGEYEVRAFYNNSFKTEAIFRFIIQEATREKAKLELSQKTYTPNEKIVVNFSGLNEQTKDWIAIYKDGTNNDWENVIDWKWAEGFDGTSTFKNLPVGQYEVRAFYNNSFKVEVKANFSVNNLFEEAREQCLIKGKSTDWVLCSPATNEAYVLDNSKLFTSTLHLADFDRGLRLGKSIASIDKPRPHNTFVGFRILKDTALIAIDVSYDMGDLIDVTTFYDLDGKVQFSTRPYQNHNDYTAMRGTINTIENGKKLKITYQEYDHNLDKWVNYEDIYNIANISDIKKISHTKI